MKTLLFIPVLMLSVNLFAEPTPARFIEGRIEFTQYDPRIGDFVIYTPQDYEINLSTCISGFENYSDWLSCQTRQGLRKKIKVMRSEFDSMADLPASERLDLRQRLSWLISYYLTLP